MDSRTHNRFGVVDANKPLGKKMQDAGRCIENLVQQFYLDNNFDPVEARLIAEHFTTCVELASHEYILLKAIKMRKAKE